MWIAFKFVSLSYDKQQSSLRIVHHRRCELLSNLYLCPMTNNVLITLMPKIAVVNCFQICIFVLWQTTFAKLHCYPIGLWIAFKFVSLSYDKQHSDDNLSACIVVNCFQICIFVLWQTTLPIDVCRRMALWIAFKFVSLSYDKQPHSIVTTKN